MFSVRVTAEVANTKTGGEGRRRRRVKTGTDEGGDPTFVEMVFSRTPTLLKKLPPEVASDPHLLVSDVADPKPAKPKVVKTDADGEKTNGEKTDEPSQPDPETATAEQLEELLTIQQLKQLASSLGLATDGKKSDLAERIAASKPLLSTIQALAAPGE